MVTPQESVIIYKSRPTPENKDRAVKNYFNLVHSIAKSFPPIGDYNDKVSEGMMALTKALDRFDPDTGLKFSTYATPVIRGYIHRLMRDKHNTIRIPAWITEMRGREERTITALTIDLKREPSESEVASALGITLKKYRSYRDRLPSMPKMSVATGRRDDQAERQREVVPRSLWADSNGDSFENYLPLSISETQAYQDAVEMIRTGTNAFKLSRKLGISSFDAETLIKVIKEREEL